MFESPGKKDEDVYKPTPVEFNNNNGSTYASDLLPRHEGVNVDRHLLNYGTQAQKAHVSSQLQTYKKCPKTYMYKYVLNVPEEPPTPLMVYGSAMHETIEYFGRYGVEKDKLSSADGILKSV